MAVEDLVEAIQSVIDFATESIVIDGVTGFIPLGAIVSLLMRDGRLRDLGSGQPSRQQISHVRSQIRLRPDLFEIKATPKGSYIKARYKKIEIRIG